MCIIVMAVRAHPEFPLVLAANRDEFDQRTAQAAHFWPDAPHVLAGRDLRSGGTWLGVTTRGRVAMVTNVRSPDTVDPDCYSRGELPVRYLLEQESHAAYLEWLEQRADAYNGFNLVVGSPTELVYCTNRGSNWSRIPAGIHGLSNAALNTGWPKVCKAKAALALCMHSRRTPKPEELFTLLGDETRAPDHELPDTGVGLSRERMLAPICVHSQGYGTQVSTVLRVHTSGRVDFWERQVRSGGRPCRETGDCGTERHFTFRIECGMSTTGRTEKTCQPCGM